MAGRLVERRIGVGRLALPVAWSGLGGRASGWLQVVAWPGLRPIAAEHAHPTDIFEGFDPSGRYLFFGADGVYVLDVATGAVTKADAGVPSDAIAWDQATHLLLPDGDTGDLTTVDINGGIVAVRPGLGDDVSASLDGSVVTAYWSQPNLRQDVALISDGSTYIVRVPCTMWPDYGPIFPQLSPHGDVLVLTCAQDDPPEVWLFQTATVLPR